ncbi:CHAT domain-containing protein [Nocardiopsis gilva YIM 90087]|uniref:CHAT domain-containing protein n=1 Tax=Nocardiopsis gilva YIM 90087 TaxID=1235441 RepID=A0A223S9U9_9ACTN|nr:CHAT domain-containing protein [Nocardiopsis gilva]ASU84910.1 CHAT domain-containing protein [Nocardiopsis gilva YIM 90087]
MEDRVLTVTEFVSDARGMGWHWTLSTPRRRPLADKAVWLDAGSWQFAAFTDLYGYLQTYTAPDVRLQQEQKIVAELGEWVAAEIYGSKILTQLGRLRGGAVVRVEIPWEARILAYRPLGAAVLKSGRALSRCGVVLVLDVRPPDEALAIGEDEKDPVGDSLRVLALFSLPEGGSALNLRKERRALERLIDGIARTQRKAIELRVVQYGATTSALREVVQDGYGWDVLHLSGHGQQGAFLLEKEDGTPHAVSAEELAELLAPLARRTRLAVVSSCSSADATYEEQVRLLGLGPARRDPGAPNSDIGSEEEGAISALAPLLAQELGCAVVGMRYPVTDDYAIAFGNRLYEQLLGKENLLGRALAHTVSQTNLETPTPAVPAISSITPVLIGAGAAGLRVAAPAARPATSENAERRREGHLQGSDLPPPHEHFVGRVRVMARIHRVLHYDSRVPGVLFFGMAGAGKTAIATELLWQRRDDFSHVVWFQVPEEGKGDLYGALDNLVGEMERKIPGLQLVHRLHDIQQLRAFLPELTAWMRHERILLVIDNLEPLLTDAGNWRDPRWGLFLNAVVDHQGHSRVLLTSRFRPADLPPHVGVEPVHALPADEAVLLAREQPRLRALMEAHDRDPTTDDGQLVRRMLAATQGHPKLIEFADSHATSWEELEAFLTDHEREWGERGLDSADYLSGGEPVAQAGAYTAVLHTWTHRALAGAEEAERLLAEVLACLEEDDRHSQVLDDTWAGVWQRLGHEGPVPEWRMLLASLEARALSFTQPIKGEAVRVLVHPEVGATLAHGAPPGVREAVDRALAAYQTTIARHALDSETKHGAGPLLLVAARRALPYLRRTGHLDVALALIEEVLVRDASAATRGALLPVLRAAAYQARGTDHEDKAEFLLARVLVGVDTQVGEQRMAALLHRLTASGDHEKAGSVAGYLADRYQAGGRLDEALEMAEQEATHTERAGRGPWTRLADQGQRLQILNRKGEHERVLGEAYRLLAEADDLPAADPATETIEEWRVREALLDTACSAALGLGRWQGCLDLTARIQRSKEQRGAHELEATRTRFNNYGPLLRLGRLAEAETLLDACRTVYKRHQAWDDLGDVFTALADLEHERGRGERAAALEHNALRYKYRPRPPDPRTVGVSHNNLGSYLGRGGDVAGGLAHHLAAALLSALTIGCPDPAGLGNAALDLHLLGDTPAPTTLDQVRAAVEQVEGVRFGAVVASLAPRQQAEDVLEGIVATARDAAQRLADEQE